VPEGDYLLKVVDSSWEEGDKADYIRWRFQIVKPKKHAGATLYANTSLSKKALWNLRNLIFAAKGKNVAGKAVKFDPESLHGITVGATVADDEYDGKIRSVPIDFFPKAKFEESDDEEEEDDDEETEEEDDDETEEELEDVDIDEL
jgi:hypothetical protein